MNLGAKPRTKDPRDILLGKVQAPLSIPPVFLPDNSWLKINFQGQTPFCGEHAGAHLKAILEHNDNGSTPRFTPRFGAIKLKDPHSSVYDGFPIDDGTTMTAIFKWLKNIGADSFDPLENDVMLPLPTYCDPSVLTDPMTADAANHKILSYAFDALTFEDLCQAIYQNKAVLILIKCDNGFWGTATPTFTKPIDGHFIVADGYDENSLRTIDSAEPISNFAVKMIAKQYITPEFFYESGTALDVPVAQLQQIVSQAAQTAEKIPQSDGTPSQKESLLEKVDEIVEDIEKIL